ncbi:AMP-binding protein [Bacillus subtilis]|uniref:AMP-binding protein n=1 Tax=Bacillus subtilis TaxID=1423 RepID=A0A8I1WJZ3_BACIU|nr:AMP-binding protein [Bacillus subtilis]MBO3797178.1 AMP-binding protein [Bacillus subtilis]
MELNMDWFWNCFKKQVCLKPNETAIVSENQALTYTDLDLKIKKFSDLLKSKGFKQGDVIGTGPLNNIDKIPVFLAILKMDGAFLNIDSRYPLQHTKKLLRDMNASFFVNNENDITILKKSTPIMDDPYSKSSNSNIKNEHKIINRKFSLIYTDSIEAKTPSTVISAKSIVNWILFNINTLKISFENTLYLSFPEMPFLFPIWMCNLVKGGKVTFLPYKKDMSFVSLSETDSSSIFLPLSVLGDFINFIPSEYELSSSIVNIVTLGEEVFDVRKFKEYLNRNNIKWHNYYGFPKINIISSINTVGNNSDDSVLQHFGKAIRNNYAYILNESYKPVPIGVRGNLFMSGFEESICNGVNIENPFKQGTLLYKTEFEAKWNKEGYFNIYDTRRTQFFNGIEINLNTLEGLLLLNPLVKDCGIKVKGDKQSKKYLIAYVVLTDDKKSVNEINDYFNNILPRDINISYIILARLPRDNQGYVDYEYLESLNFLSSIELEELTTQIKNIEKIEELIIFPQEHILKSNSIDFTNYN